MSAAATLHRSTANPSTAVVQCALCSRWGRWDWRAGLVRHGRDGKVVCVLPEPSRKKELR